ncbi:IS3 family transposase [Streptomyces sp. NBC_00328]|uniref:IS3 family transposase n=1 Tax=Streptomyces sp. NBC_00328 TaxID=2903646 RepID=UPI002E2A4045|nr:IS3 family transposase [Streptomyces sp. NBC_00328]
MTRPTPAAPASGSDDALFGTEAADYARYRPGLPDAAVRLLAATQHGVPGPVLLDLGTGTGQVPRALLPVLHRLVHIDLVGIHGLPGPVRVKHLRGVVTAEDLVDRTFHRLRPDELWVTDITQHRTREGWVYCAAVLDAFSRRIVGWSIDSRQDSTLVVNALDMAIRNRRPEPGGIVHADHGTQFTSWVFGERIRSAGLLPSFGTVGDGLDNAMTESFRSSMQIELLNRRWWKTRVELANVIFEFIEIFYNRQRRHSALGYRTPIEYELLSENDTIPAAG